MWMTWPSTAWYRTGEGGEGLPAVQANWIEETRLVMESTLPRGTQPSADWLRALTGRGSLLVAAGCFPTRAGAQAAPAREGLPAWHEERQNAPAFFEKTGLASSQTWLLSGSSLSGQPYGGNILPPVDSGWARPTGGQCSQRDHWLSPQVRLHLSPTTAT